MVTQPAAPTRPTASAPRSSLGRTADVPTLAEAIALYMDHAEHVARRSPATLRAYWGDLARFAASDTGLGMVPLDQITPADIGRWQATMRHLADATVRRGLNALSSLFRWAVRFGHCAHNPVDQIERPRRRRRALRAPSQGQVAAMLAATRGLTERAMLLALATSGLRRAEALSLDWRHVDLPGHQLTVRGKGDKDRTVVIFRDLLAALHALHAQQGFPAEGPVFRGRQGRPLQKSTLQRWLNRWLQAAGLRTEGCNAFTLHSLRRFAAKQWLDNGLNIRQVQLLLGHEGLQTTMLYLDYTPEDLHAAAQTVDFGLGAADG